MAKRRKGKNSLIESISAQAALQQEPVTVELSSEISSSNKQLDSKSEYENLVNDIETNADICLQDSKYLVIEDPNAAVPEPLPFAPANDSAVTALSSANMKLQSENASLQEENDKYLMKISELTFENAKLNAQLQELSKSTTNNAMPRFNESTIQNIFDQRAASKNVNYPYHHTNLGYTSWN